MNSELVAWLLDTDPALKWQVQRDLLGDPEWESTRVRTAAEGFGASLLAKQDADGQWDGGAYFPGGFDFEGPEAQPGTGQPYTATTWTLNALRDWGVPAAALGDTADRLRLNSRWEYENLPYWGGEVDACINGFTLANGAWLGVDVEVIAQWFVDHQMDEGGWNCEWVNGSTRASFDSTLNALRGIIYYELAGKGTPELKAARKRAEEFLLERNLLFKKSDGSLADPTFHRVAYPLRWFYGALNVLDYFRMASAVDGDNRDPRMQAAIDSVLAQQTEDGRWLQGRRHPGRVWFEVDVDAGEPSPWLTMYAMRVLNWWNAPRP
jgi:hypothetical protein